MNRKALFIIISTIIFALTISCSKGQASSEDKNTLLVDVGAEGATVDPARAENAEEFRVINDLFAGLVDFDQSNKPIPGLASSWDISPDGKTYTFHLRPNLKFSDGTPLTAKDVVYSWKRLVDPKTAAAYNFLLAGVVNAKAIMDGTMPINSLGISAPDPQTVVVNLVHPMNEFLVYITAPGVSIVPEQTIEKFGNAWTDPHNIVTSGAYTMIEHVVNGYILNKKNLNYYAVNDVHIDKVKYFPFVDTTVGISTYKTGGLDTTWKNVPVDKFEVIKQQYGDQLHVTPAERTNHLSFNLKLAKYADNLNLRQALSMAIDRTVLANQVLKSGQKPLYSIITPTIEHGAYADVKYDWANWPRDKQITMAQKLYQGAGYGPNHELNVTLSYYTNDINKKTCLAIAAMWKAILGVNVTLSVQELKSFVAAGHKGDFDIRLSTWGADYDSVTTYTPLYQCGNENNYSQYCSNRYEAQITQAGQATDTIKQTAIYKAAITTALNDYPVIPLNQPAQQRLVKPRVQGYQIDKNYLDNVQSKWFTLAN